MVGPPAQHGNVTSLLGASGSSQQPLMSLRCWAAGSLPAGSLLQRRGTLGATAGANLALAGLVPGGSAGRLQLAQDSVHQATGLSHAAGQCCTMQAAGGDGPAPSEGPTGHLSPWRSIRPVPDKPRHVIKTANGRYKVEYKPPTALYPGTKRLNLGTYPSKSEAAEVADTARAALGQPPANFPGADYSAHPLVQRLQLLTQRGAGFDELQAAARKVLGIRARDKQGAYSTPFVGVWQQQRSYRFRAIIQLGSATYSLGMHDSAEDAARVWDRVMARLRCSSNEVDSPWPGTLNFPGEQAEVHPWLEEVLSRPDLQGHQLLEACSQACNDVFKSMCSSAFRGVTWQKRDKAWLSRKGLDGSRLHLGYYSSEVEAARAYDRAVLLKRHRGLATRKGRPDITNFPEHEYEGDVMLAEAKQYGLGMHEFSLLCQERAKALREEEVEVEQCAPASESV